MYLRDKNGSPISHFTQWDTKQYIYVYNWEYGSVPKFHFQNRRMRASVSVDATQVDGNTVRVMVPDEMLEIVLPVEIGVYVVEDGSGTTVFRDRIPVRAKKQPTDEPYDWDADTDDGNADGHKCVIIDDTEPAITPVLWFDTGTPI